MAALPKIKKADDRLWEGFQRARRTFLGVSIVLALYSWGNVTLERFSFLGGGFVIKDEWAFQFLVLLIWVALGWRYWIHEKEVSEEELAVNEDRAGIKFFVVSQMWRQELLREITPRLEKDLEEIVRPEIEERKKSEDPIIRKEFSSGAAREEASFSVLKANLIKSEIKGRKLVYGIHKNPYEKDVGLSISGYENMRAYLKASLSIAATFRPFSDFKGPYLVAALALLGLIRKGMCLATNSNGLPIGI